MIRAIHGTISKTPSVSYDTDAQTFFTATGITDSTQKSAVNDLVLALKAASVWSKLLAAYPFVGGSASTHKYNLKDAQDTDGAYRLTFSGGWTHSSSGAKPNGSTGYADTYLTPSSVINSNEGSIGVYSTENGDSMDIGAYDGTNITQIYFASPSIVYPDPCTTVATSSGAGRTNSLGFFAATRTSSTAVTKQENGSQSNLTSRNAGRPTNTIYIGARRNPSSVTYGSHNLAFAFVGQSLSTTELDDLYDAVVIFETALSRNV